MTVTATLNIWHALRQELGGAVARELSLENDRTAPQAMRRMQVELRAYVGR